MLLTRRAKWQRSALIFCAGSLASFIANLSFTLWATTRPGSNIEGGVGVLAQETSCSTAKNINTGIHVLINVLSTILLAGSNYCMQCLSAPTREQIDEAHRQSRWVDVGVQSIRNLLYITSPGNKLLWVLLSLSSLPLHLFYNSAIFTSISTNEYKVTIVNEGFMALQNRSALPAYLRNDNLEAMHTAAIEGRLDRLDRSACLDAYASNFQSTRGDMLLVTPGFPLPATPPYGKDFRIQRNASFVLQNFACGIRQAYQWMCSQDPEYASICSTPCEDVIPRYKADPDGWTPFGVAAVKECYSLPTEERCKLLFSPTLCWLVTALNLFKGILMLATALRRDTRPILTVGDAVASFMAVPDEWTTDMCLVSKQDVVKSKGLWPREPMRLEFRRRRKFAAASAGRWMTCVLMYVLAIALCIFLFSFGYGHISGSRDLSSLMALGLGTLSSKTIIQSDFFGRGWTNLLANVVMANSPQAIMSMLYFTYNGLFTSISLATEWDSYARHRKGLRVSSAPVGAQRAEYFLQLPYRYSIPLLAISGVLHWLISQSIFLVFVEVYQDSVDESKGAREPAFNYTTCGWSPAGVLSVIAVGIVMVGFLLASGSRKLSSGVMPVAGSCSAGVSAACHAVPYDEMACVEPLRWGATCYEEDEKKGHCSFSSAEVDTPFEGVLYS
ncbi:hypothetical protein C8A03DRAFT_38010 [Achaetomium macrosporum]|uniref:DUF6536 domain-containing protein n=1 Tax=Achaetomium macrosporum TaxID=79813 RepID=A0AAN7C2M6_9PEZI|nr:hypothetical protein C8A03DRAFT_38010 [Achaetomium macrosporum]